MTGDSRDDLAEFIRSLVVRELTSGSPAQGPPAAPPGDGARPAPRGKPDLAASPEDIALAKKVAAWLGADIPPSPWFGSWRPRGDRAFYLGRTPARLGIGRAGVRFRTDTVLSFLADHAAARDAVHSDLAPELFRDLGLTELRSAAADKQQFLARPELGRRLSDESAAVVARSGVRAPQVQIVAGDGLSATAINVNLPLLLPVLERELRRSGVRLGTVFGVRNSRVACGDHVARLAEAEVLCMIVGERPGLKTAESVGAYITYMKVREFHEAMRNVVSNIHRGGLPPETEGARQIAGICLRALKEKRTGVEVS